jgi:hypothetical protein
MEILSLLLAAVGVLSAGVIYGTDMLGAIVGRPTWEHVDVRTMVIATGTMHHYGDRRFPIPGILSIVATVLAGVASGIGGHWLAAAAAAVASVALVIWLTIFKTVNAPINKELSLAAHEGRVPDNARALQARWDSVINLRAALQGIAVAALCVVLVLH